MVAEVLQFINSVRKHWGVLVTSGGLIGVLGIWQGLGHQVWHWIYWLVALGGFAVACFKSWNDEVQRGNNLVQALNQETDKERNMRSAIYSEMGQLYMNITFMLTRKCTTPLEQEGIGVNISELSIRTYEWAKSQPDLFYRLKESRAIDTLYSPMEYIKKRYHGIPDTGKYIMEMAAKFASMLEDYIVSGLFDKTLFEQKSPREYQAIMKKRATSTVQKQTDT